jgi:hypothetical protein
LWALYCDEGDDRLKLSASAGFALITEDDPACQRFLDEIGSWPDLFKEIIQAENPEVQRRCLMAIANIVEKSEANASRIMAVGFCAKRLYSFHEFRRKYSKFLWP